MIRSGQVEPLLHVHLQKKLTAAEFLKLIGVKFADGASAEYVRATSTLIVRNSLDQLDLVEAMIESSFGSVAKLLRIDVKTMEIAEESLKELGFDWLLGQFNVPGNNQVFGAGGTSGNRAVGRSHHRIPVCCTWIWRSGRDPSSDGGQSKR